MFENLFLKGFLVGFSIAMPLGSIGILCLRYALLSGFLYGIASGFGVALADAVCGFLAGFGVLSLDWMISGQNAWFQFIGALILWYIGLSIFFSKPKTSSGEEIQHGYFRVFFTLFMLTLLNPMTIISFAGIYAALGIGTTQQDLSANTALTSGVFSGSMLWWVILSFGAWMLGSKMDPSSSNLINKISGGIIIIFALLATIAAINNCLFC